MWCCGAALWLWRWAAPGAFAAPAAASPARGSVPLPALDLDAFEDDDCLEAPDADILLTLMHNMCEVLERVLHASDREEAWAEFDAWGEVHFAPMMALANGVLGRPYCEPGKVAWMATECLTLLRGGEQGVDAALKCAAALDEDLLAQMTPRGSSFSTRMHMVMRSPWPAFRLLDLLVRLHPESASTRMGACRSYQNWRQEPDAFDWPWFKPLLTAAIDALVQDASALELRPADGPLSRQYHRRWLRVHGGAPGIREVILFSDDVSEAYREHHYRAGCHVGVISCYVLQVLLVHLHDVEGRLHRFAASVAQLINLHAPFSHLIKTDWPLFRLLHVASLLQRVPPTEVWQGAPQEKRAPPDAARTLCKRVEDAVRASGPARKGLDGTAHIRGGAPAAAGAIAYITAAWGHLAGFAGRVLERWDRILGDRAALLFLALDAEALRQCSDAVAPAVHCIDAPRRLGVEGAVAKYLAMAAATRLGVVAAWLDLDVYVAKDPAPHIQAAMDAPLRPELVFARHIASESMSPALLAARASPEATDLLLRYAGWLRENPYLLDHRGWDQLLHNRAGDFAGGFDYKGRNVTIKDDKGPNHSFMPKAGVAPPGVPYSALGEEFGSGDGWLGQGDGSGLALFHFWGAEEAQEELFGLLYPHGTPGFPDDALEVVKRYHRVVTTGPQVPALLSGTRSSARPMHLVCISYAAGCCEKSLRKNRKQALAVGCDEARAYGREDLGPAWAERHSGILSQRRGGGWWLWKPYLILRALKDPAVPWHTGVVAYVDAGNFLHADPRPLAAKALRGSDISAMRLKWCLEADWTSPVTLQRLNISDRYAVVERPQLGAYFLLLRKTEVTISFVETWLRLSEDQETLTGMAADGPADVGSRDLREPPSFQKHQADQSIFSILFKEHGFRAITLEEGHRVVTLARWRE